MFEGVRAAHTACPCGLRLIYAAVVGSRAYGTATEQSDVDVRGVVLPPVEKILGLEGFEQCVSPEGDTIFYDLRKFLRLALAGNPSILEMLWVPEDCVLAADEYGRMLMAARQAFLSKRIYRTFGGYARSQFGKMLRREGAGTHGVRQDLLEAHGYDTKNAMHLIRLLRMGIEALRDGVLNVRRPDAAELLAIRQGKYTLAEVVEMSRRLEAELERAYRLTSLPDEPDSRTVEDLCVSILRDYVCSSGR